MCARGAAPLFDPTLDFVNVPNHASRGQIEAAWELAPLFHLVNSSVSERHHLPELMAPNRTFEEVSGFGGRAFKRCIEWVWALGPHSAWLRLPIHSVLATHVGCLIDNRCLRAIWEYGRWMPGIDSLSRARRIAMSTGTFRSLHLYYSTYRGDTRCGDAIRNRAVAGSRYCP